MCFYCKLPINVDKNGNGDAVFVDGKFYHEKCFTKKIEPQEKCYLCKKDIDFSDNNIAYYDNHFWHVDCIIKKSQKTKTAKWKLAVKTLDNSIAYAKEQEQMIRRKFQVALNDIPKYKADADKEIRRWYAESKLNDYIRMIYGVKNIPWQALGQIYKGTYRGMSTPIPAEHLLDMWRRKQNYLNKVYQLNKSKGKIFTSEQRINYDIAILVRKYDSYLQWRREQEMLSVEQNNPVKDNMWLATQVIAAQPKIDNNEQEGFENIADEVFG